MPRRMRFRAPKFFDTGEQYADIIQLWALRMLVKLRGYRRVGTGLGFGTDSELVLQAAGLSHMKDEEFKDKDIKKAAAQQLSVVDARRPKLKKGPLNLNTGWLAKSLSLSCAEIEILRFMVLANTVTCLSEAAETLGDLDEQQVQRALAVILGQPIEQTHAALHREGTLIASGLMRFERDGIGHLHRKLQVIRGLPDTMLTPQRNPAELFIDLFREAPAPQLTRADYTHIAADYELLTNYLRDALRRKAKGVNVLIFGPRGPGRPSWLG